MYDFIEREVKDAMRRFTSVKHRSLLCYRVEVQEIPERIDIGFEFAGGATISVEARDLFLPNGTPGTLCLGITRSVDDDMIIIGAISMQGYNIGYNVNQTPFTLLNASVNYGCVIYYYGYFDNFSFCLKIQKKNKPFYRYFNRNSHSNKFILNIFVIHDQH